MATCGKCRNVYPMRESRCPKCSSTIRYMTKELHLECSNCGANNSAYASQCGSCESKNLQ